jgi:hypothetical protein
MAAPTGVVVSGAADTVTTLLDEYGGVAVFRVESAALAPQILVLVSVNGNGWSATSTTSRTSHDHAGVRTLRTRASLRSPPLRGET